MQKIDFEWVKTLVLFFCCFPTDDNLLHSGDNRDKVAKLSETEPKFDVYGPPTFLGRDPKFLT